MIKKVRIRNFKSLGDVSIDLEPVTVLIGRSGTGKSNFFEALRFLRDCVCTRNPGVASNNRGGWGMMIPVTANGPVVMSFFIKFGAPGVSEDYEYELVFQQQPHHHGMPLLEERLL